MMSGAVHLAADASLPPPEEVGHEINNNNNNSESGVNANGQQQQQQQQQEQQQNEFMGNNKSVATLSSPWQYDALASHCMGCSTEFNPLNRRHHCRLCGKVFCNDCSKQKALIPPSSIVLVPKGGKKVKPEPQHPSFSPDQDPDRMLTYLSGGNANELLYGKGLEERFKLAREPLRVCQACFPQLAPLQEDLRASNSNAMRFNHIDPTDARRLFNSPIANTLGHEIRKAAYTLNNLLPQPRRMGALVSATPGLSTLNGDLSELAQCKEHCSSVSPNLGDLDGVRIPARLLEEAKGIAVMTVMKGGLGLAGFEFGTGLVVARTEGGRWSAPSAIGTGGISWGALIGAQVSDHVFLLMNDAAVRMIFADKGSVQLGADVGVALGPLGRAVEGNLGAAVGKQVAPIYSYSLSKGLYAGISLDGKVIVTRHNVNEKFYGRPVTGEEILAGAVPLPPAAQPLYEALARCHVYASQHIEGLQGRNYARMQHEARANNFTPEHLPMAPPTPTQQEYGEWQNSPKRQDDNFVVRNARMAEHEVVFTNEHQLPNPQQEPINPNAPPQSVDPNSVEGGLSEVTAEHGY